MKSECKEITKLVKIGLLESGSGTKQPKDQRRIESYGCSCGGCGGCGGSSC